MMGRLINKFFLYESVTLNKADSPLQEHDYWCTTSWYVKINFQFLITLLSYIIIANLQLIPLILLVGMRIKPSSPYEIKKKILGY